MDCPIIKYKNIQGVFHLEIGIEDDITLIETPLDKEGIKLLIEHMDDFIDDAIWDVTEIIAELNENENGVMLYMYTDDDTIDEDPISEVFFFDDFITPLLPDKGKNPKKKLSE